MILTSSPQDVYPEDCMPRSHIHVEPSMSIFNLIPDQGYTHVLVKHCQAWEKTVFIKQKIAPLCETRALLVQ